MGIYKVLVEQDRYFTVGLKKKHGFEFEIILDDLIEKQNGLEVAELLFDTLTADLENKKVKANLVLFNNTTPNKAILKVGTGKNTLRLVFSDPYNKWPWEYGNKCNGLYGNQMKGIWTLYDVLTLLNGYFTPNSKVFFNYVLWTSTRHTNFLRTCYCKKAGKLRDDKPSAAITHIVVGFLTSDKSNPLFVPCLDRKGLKKDLQTCMKDLGSFTSTKMQIIFARNNEVKQEVELNSNLGFTKNYVFELKSGCEVDNSFL